MKTEISKECFIREFESLLRAMAKYLKEDKEAYFRTAQSEYGALLDFAFTHDLLSDDEYARYSPSEYCLPDEFVYLYPDASDNLKG